jgi:cell division protein FtsL
MKATFLTAACAFTLLAPSITRAQAPGVPSEQRLLELVKEVQTQQGQIAENQTKIDEKLTEVAETVRVARIFSSRGGRGPVK